MSAQPMKSAASCYPSILIKIDITRRVYVLDGLQYLIIMTEEGRDYFLQFINSSTQVNQKLERKADLSLLMELRLPEVAKKEEVQEKLHPLVQIAYEKKTKASTAVDQIIGQRIRCSTYVEIAKEEEQEMERRKKRGPRYGFGQKRLATKESNDERSNTRTRRTCDNDSDRMNGPPYRPNVLKMEELFANQETQSNEPKPYRYHAGSRSRSKHARKVIKQIKNQKLKRQRELKKADEEKGKMEEEIPVQKEQETLPSQANNPIIESVNEQKLKTESIESNELKHQEKYIKASIPRQQEPQPSQQKQPLPSHTPSNIQTDLAERQRRIQEREAALQRQKEKLEKEKEQRRIEREKRQIQRRAAEIAQRQEQLRRKQAALEKKLQHQDKSKSRKDDRSSKRKGNYQSSSHKSTNSSMQEESWRHHLRQITHYNPHDPKYRNRDRQQIKESSFSRLNKEEARSRKLGVLEQQRELQRERRRKQY